MEEYTPLNTLITNAVGKKKCENNEKERNAILCGLTNPTLKKIMHCKLAKEVWEKLEKIYEGDKKVKRAML